MNDRRDIHLPTFWQFVAVCLGYFWAYQHWASLNLFIIQLFDYTGSFTTWRIRSAVEELHQLKVIWNSKSLKLTQLSLLNKTCFNAIIMELKILIPLIRNLKKLKKLIRWIELNDKISYLKQIIFNLFNASEKKNIRREYREKGIF